MKRFIGALVLASAVLMAPGCAQFGLGGTEDSGPPCRLIEVYVREGCPYCALAKGYLENLKSRRPDLDIRLYDVKQNEENMGRYRSVIARYGLQHPGVPTFDICGQVYVGFSETKSPAEIETLLGD